MSLAPNTAPETGTAPVPRGGAVPALFSAAIVIPAVALLIWYLVTGYDILWPSRWTLLTWIAALAALEVLEIPTDRDTRLNPSEPIALAACLLFPPASCFIVVFFGSRERVDFHNWRITLRGLCNRSHAALGSLLASVAVQPLTGRTTPVTAVAAVAIAWVIWTTENYLIVAAGLAAYSRMSLREALGQLRMGAPGDYAIIVVAWCFSAVLLVLLHNVVGSWALLLIAIPSVLCRQVLARSDSLLKVRKELARQLLLVNALTNRIASERRDERLRIAADLHDEVMQPLFQVSLLAHVTNRDLVTGRLLELEEDLSHLTTSAGNALGKLREVVGALRTSPLGLRGLGSAINTLASDLDAPGSSRIRCSVSDLGELSAGSQLAIYQVAREALTNAARHSRAEFIELTLQRDSGGRIVLVVEDDGIGFDTMTKHANHFGLLIMRERGEATGGSVYIDSLLGRGTKVTAWFPCLTDGPMSR